MDVSRLFLFVIYFLCAATGFYYLLCAYFVKTDAQKKKNITKLIGWLCFLGGAILLIELILWQ
jgi:RsiW-degrading membrane proteinase PrsW (M82 family)